MKMPASLCVRLPEDLRHFIEARFGSEEELVATVLEALRCWQVCSTERWHIRKSTVSGEGSQETMLLTPEQWEEILEGLG